MDVTSIKETLNSMSAIADRIKSSIQLKFKPMPEDGVDYYNMKLNALSTYLLYVTKYCKLKCDSSQPIAGHQVFRDLQYFRLFNNRLRMLDAATKPLIEKVVASEKKAVNIDNMVFDEQDDSKAAYKAPKLTPVQVSTGKERVMGMKKKRLNKSEWVKELKRDLNDEPEEIKMREVDEDEEAQEELEESMFKRTSQSKKIERKLNHKRKMKREKAL